MAGLISYFAGFARGTGVCFSTWLAVAWFAQNLNRQALKVLFVGGDDDVFKAAGNF